MKRLVTILLLSLLLCVSTHAVVNTTTVKTEPLAGNGSTTAFTFSFSFTATSEIDVDVRTTSTGAVVRQTETTHYSVSAASDTGGTVTFVTAPAATETVTISRTTVQTQASDIDAASSISLTSLEAAYDKAMRLIQELFEITDRCLKIPITDSTTLTTEIDNSVDRASRVIGSDASGNINTSAAVPTGSVAFTTFGENMAEAATVSAGRVLLALGWYNVLDYGATGDGSTDDTAGVQAAIDAATSGSKIYFPTGVYLCNSNIFANQASIRFVGDTPLSSHLADLANASVIKMNSDANLFVVSATSVSFENLYLDGNGKTGPIVRIGTGSGISATNFRDVTFLNGQPAVYAENAVHGTFVGCTFRDCGTSTTTPAMEFFNGENASTNCSDWTFTACTWEDVSGDQIEFDSSGAGSDNAGFYFHSPKMESADATGFVFLKGTVDLLEVFGGQMINESGADCINLTGSHIKLFGCHLTATTRVVSITGNANDIISCLGNCTDAGATTNFVVTGNNNRLIANNKAGYGDIVASTGNNNTELANRNSILDGLTPPDANTWTVGDICFNYTPSAGRPIGWMCGVAGTPGTWYTMGRVSGATAKTAAYTIVVGENGRMFSNEGDDDVLVLTLPPAVVGLQYGGIRLASFAMRFDPDGTETIRGGGAGKYLELDADGNSVVLECFEDGKWEIVAEHLNDGGAHTFEG